MSRARDIANLIGGATPDIILKTADGAILNLQTSDTTVTDGSVLGAINFTAPNEGSGTDSLLVGAVIQAEAEGTFAADNNATSIVFKTGASEAAATKMTLTSAGRLGIGTSSPGNDVEIITSADAKGLTIKNAGNNRPYLNFDSNRSSAGNNLAHINFAWNGTDAARILAVAGADTSNKDDGHLVFATASAGSPAEILRITSAGKVGIGTTAPNGVFEVHTAQNTTNQFTTPHITLDTSSTTNSTGFTGIAYSTSTGPNYGITAGALRAQANGKPTFVVNTHEGSASGTQRFYIDDTGFLVLTSTGWDQVFDNSDTDVVGVQLAPTGGIGIQLDKNGTDTEGIVMNNINSASATNMVLQYRTQQTIEGSVQGNGSGLSFVNVSDYRKKENITDLSGSLAKIKALRPVTFTHKSAYTTDTSAVKTGMIAHEVAKVLPNLVVGEKDAVDDDDNIVLQALAYSGDEMITHLIGAIKELEARIATLEG